MKEERIEISCTVESIRYYKDAWGIISVSVKEVMAGSPITDKWGELILKGNMPQVKQGFDYHVVAEYVNDPKWGGQYNILRMYSIIDLDNCNDEMKHKFLSILFTEKQLTELYKTLDDPFTTLKNEDATALVTVKGVGFFKAIDYINRFKTNIHLGRIFTELADYNLTNNMVQRLMDRYGSPDVIIQKIKDNPYILANEVEGIGWATADKIALAGGINKYDPRRIGAYIYKYLNDKGKEGYSWITSDELMGGILEGIGDDTPDSQIGEAIHQMEDRLWYNEDKSKIGLRYYYDIEKHIAEELIRLRDADPFIPDSSLNDWEDIIKRLEKRQGWQYTNEQIDGIKLALTNNITLITGMAGTGKSTLVRAILQVLGSHTYVQCALSGRAASRLSEITGEEGQTIHRLLGYPCHTNSGKDGFAHHEDCPLDYEIYILDEISMVDSTLFYYLLRAIPSGAKLICLGDHGQLEAIGSGNIAHDMISSPEIPTVMLTKIQRQAEASGIISEAFKVRNGQQIIEEEWTGTTVKGALKDLKIIAYSDASNTFYKIMAEYSALFNSKDFDLLQTQIIVPVKNKGSACTSELNNAVQELINPANKKKKETLVHTLGRNYILREGDKVINVQNNYKTSPPIYNGNMGIIRSINEENEEMIIDFMGIGEVAVERKFWNNIDLGYAITIHKSQGSEWDHVIIGIDFSGYIMLTRELLYTAITRAKKSCYLSVQTNAFRYATANEAVKNKTTHLKELLHEVAHPKLTF